MSWLFCILIPLLCLLLLIIFFHPVIVLIVEKYTIFFHRRLCRKVPLQSIKSAIKGRVKSTKHDRMSPLLQKVGKRLGGRIPSVFPQREVECLLYRIHTVKHNGMDTRGLSGKSPAIVNIRRTVCVPSM